MKLLMPFQDESSVHDVYYGKMKSGKYIVKFNLEDNPKILSASQFEARRKGAQEIEKEEAKVSLTL